MPRYQLMGGQHIQADPTKGINPATKKPYSRLYKAEPGKPLPVFDSNSSVCANDPRKFRRVDPVEMPPLTEEATVDSVAVMDAPAAPPKYLLAELEAMTLENLRELAATEEIDVAGATTKSVIIRLILAEC